jgi:isoleucyl-tRNA synthetase
MDVQTEEMPKVRKEWLDDKLAEKWDRILNLRYDVTKALELARREKLINHSLTAQVDLYPGDSEIYNFLNEIEDPAEILIVSELVIHKPGEEVDAAQEGEYFKGLKIAVSPARGTKCERCWMYSNDVGSDAENPELCPRCSGVLKAAEK